MCIHTIEVEYQEPFTGIWVRGRNEYFFRNEKEVKETVKRWKNALTDLYGKTVEVHDLTEENF